MTIQWRRIFETPIRLAFCGLIRRARPGLRFVCIDWQRGFNSASRFPHFHFSVSHASFHAGLGVYGGAIDYMSIAEREARSVPGALDYITV